MRRRYYVYILRCADDSYYTGITNDIRRRLKEHQSAYNGTSYTASRRPVTLVYCCRFKYVLNAIAWEKQLKGWSRKKKEALMYGEIEKLPGLAKKDFRKKRR